MPVKNKVKGVPVQPVKVKIVNQTTQVNQFQKKPTYLLELEEKWKRWTGIDSKEAEEAISDLSGGLYTEMRKLEAQLCKEIESRELPEDFKEFVKAKLRDAWRDIISHQKVGMDKICIVIREHIKE
jgi:hypothetical protein